MTRVIKALASLVFAASNAAHAGLIGDEVQARWIFAPSFDQTSIFVVGPGTELAGTWGSDNNLDVGDNYIEAAIPNGVGVGSGVSWHFSSLDFGGIGGFSVSTNFQGWSDSWLSFTSDSIDITFFNSVEFPLTKATSASIYCPHRYLNLRRACGCFLGLPLSMLLHGATRSRAPIPVNGE